MLVVTQIRDTVSYQSKLSVPASMVDSLKCLFFVVDEKQVELIKFGQKQF